MLFLPMSVLHFFLHHSDSPGTVPSLLLNSLSKNLQESVVYASTASELWSDLRDHFSHSNYPCNFQLRQFLATFQQELLSITNYFTIAICCQSLFSCSSRGKTK
ncbi:hypothetical protein AMTRI_Chr13g118240 [Amborella trichopoda]